MSDSEGDAASAGEAAPARKRRRRGCGCWTIALTAFVLLVVLPVVATLGIVLVLRYNDARAIEAELAREREAGHPITVDEIDAYYPTDPQIAEATGHWQRAIDVVGEDRFGDREVDVPLMSEERGFRGERPPELDDRGLLAGEDLRVAREFVSEYRAAIAAAHAARRAGAVARFPIELKYLYATRMPHIPALRGLADLLRLDLEVRLVEDDVDAAAEDLLSLVAVGESLAYEPILVSQMVRNAVYAIAMNAAERLLWQADPEVEQLERIGAAFVKADFRDSFRRGINGERYVFVQSTVGDAPLDDENLQLIRNRWFRSLDLKKGLELYGRLEAASDRGLLAAVEEGRAIEEELKKLAEGPSKGVNHVATLLYFPAPIPHAISQLRTDAVCELAVVATACERYRIAEGKLPPTLNSLVPGYLPTPPIDPMDGRSLRYVPHDDGSATLYSISQDFTDDGGLVDVEDADGGPWDILFVLRPSSPTPAP